MTTRTIKITEIGVGDSSDANNVDDIFLILQPDGGTPIRYPFVPGTALPGMVDNSLVLDGSNGEYFPVYVSFKTMLQITAYDLDPNSMFGGSDYCGTARVLQNDMGGTLQLASTNYPDDDGPTDKLSTVTIQYEDVSKETGYDPSNFMDDNTGMLSVQASGYLYEARQQVQANSDSASAMNTDDMADGIKLSSDFAKQAQQALDDYKATSDGADLIANAPSMSQPQIIEALQKMVQYEGFKDLAEAATNHTAATTDTGGPINIGSFFVTVSFQIQAGFGVAGGISFAIDPSMQASSNWDGADAPYYAIVVSGGTLIGGDAGVETSIGRGISTSEPNDMGGTSLGIGINAAFQIGIAGSFSKGLTIEDDALAFTKGWTILISPSTGIDFGATLELSHSVVIMDRTVPLIAQDPGKYMFMVQEVHCLQKSDLDGNNDEIVFEFLPKGTGKDYYFYPTWGEFSIAEDQYYNDDPNSTAIYKPSYWYPDLAINTDDKISLTVYEANVDVGTFNPDNDHNQALFTVILNLADNGNGSVSANIEKTSDRYSIYGYDGTDLDYIHINDTFYVEFHDTSLLNEIYYKMKFNRQK